MDKRPLFSLAVSFSLGAAFAVIENPTLRIIFLVIFALISLSFLKRRKAAFLVVAAAFIFGLFRGEAHMFVRTQAKMASEDLSKEEEVFYGKAEKTEEKTSSYAYYLKEVSFRSDGKNYSPGGLIFYLDEKISFVPGSLYKLEGTPSEISERENEGGFSEKEYLSGKDIGIKLFKPKITLLKKPVFSIRQVLSDLRERLKNFFEDNLPGEEGAILSAMALGDKGGLSSDVKDLFSASGIAHLLAVSGLHISIVGSLIYKLLRRLRFSFFMSFLISIPFSFLYAQMCGMSVSAERALIMFFLSLLSESLGREADMLTNEGVAAVILIMKNPFCLFDSAFVFSFSAVFIVAAAGRPISEALESFIRERHREIRGYKPSIFEKFIMSFVFSFTVCLGTAPIVALYYYEIPLYQVFLNLILIPLMTALLFMALVSGILFLKLLLFPVHLLLYFYEWLSELTLKLPFSSLTFGKPGELQIVLYFILFFVGVYFALKLLRTLKSREDLADPVNAQKKDVKAYLPKAAVVFILLPVILSGFKGGGFEFDMLSVGQGDGLYLRTDRKTHIMIDGGSTSKKEVARNVILPFLKSRGVTGGIDYWFVSHLDTDHVSGLIEALESGYPVQMVILPKKVVENENFERLITAVKMDGAALKFMEKGERLVLSGGNTVITCLFSGTDEYLRAGDANANSLVLLVERKDLKASILLTGDIGSEQEEMILSDETAKKMLCEAAKKTLILKAAHHGSNYSNCNDLLSILSGREDITLISAGKGNRYGHPGKETIARLDSLSIEHLCTIEKGQIKVFEKNGILDLETMSG